MCWMKKALTNIRTDILSEETAIKFSKRALKITPTTNSLIKPTDIKVSVSCKN